MNSRQKEILTDGIKQIDSELLKNGTVDLIEKHYNQITVFNDALGLVNSEDEELVIRHFLDSLAPYPIIREKLNGENLTFADLGSGNGLPGLVLASAFNDSKFVLVERMGRRAGFLRNTIAQMNCISRISVEEKDLKEIRDTFDAVVFRAFRPLKDIARDLNRITSDKSKIFIYKSSKDNIEEEIESAKKYFAYEVVPYHVPFLDEERSLLILMKLC